MGMRWAMIDVYYYIEKEKAKDAVSCGLKLSEWSDRTVLIGREHKKCLTALLNPKDDMGKYGSDELTCLKMHVESRFCYVAERSLYIAGQKSEKLMKLYLESIVPSGNYIFGQYRFPECLLITTMIGGNIKILNRRIDSPRLCENSKDLYVNNMAEHFREKHKDFNNDILYYFLMNTAHEDQTLEVLTDEEEGITFFVDALTGKVFTIGTPNIDEKRIRS